MLLLQLLCAVLLLKLWLLLLLWPLLLLWLLRLRKHTYSSIREALDVGTTRRSALCMSERPHA